MSESERPDSPAAWDALLKEVSDYPLFTALFGRRARRFGWGMEIPNGPMAYRSEHAPCPLDRFERALLVAAGLGVSGWHNGIPFTASEDGLCTYSTRLTGRTAPSAAGFGTPEIFITEDSGTYLVRSRDAGGAVNWNRDAMGSAAALIEAVESHFHRVSDSRIELPRQGPHYSEHNIWNANVPGSTLFMPVTDVAEQMLGFLFVVAGAGYTIFDQAQGRPLGDVETHHRSGLLDPARRYPFNYMEQYVLTTAAVEEGIICHNVHLALQALGLGGWLFTGISPFSLMGAMAGQGVPGLGFEFQTDPRWDVPNPVGLEGFYEATCPPRFADMHAATAAYVEAKYGRGSVYDPDQPGGPYADNARTKAAAERPNEALVGCVASIAQDIFESYGKFPGTVPSVYMRYYAQAHRLETGFYDRFYGPDQYLDTHRRNVDRWSGVPDQD